MAFCAKAKGVLNLVLNGQSLRLQSDGEVTILASLQNRTPTYDGEFTIEDRNPQIVASVVVPNSMYVTNLQEICNVPVIVELADGRTFSMTDASNVSQDPYDAKNNTQPLLLIGSAIEEILPVT